MARLHYFYGWLNITFYKHIFSIHSSINGHLGCFLILAVVNNVVNIGVHIYFWVSVFFPLSDKYPEVELLDHMIVQFLIFLGTSIVSSIAAAPNSCPLMHKDSLLSTSLPALLNSCPLGNSYFNRCDILLWFWFAFFLVISNVEHLFMYCWPWVCLWKNVSLGPLPIFKLDFFFSWIVWLLYIFWILTS